MHTMWSKVVVVIQTSMSGSAFHTTGTVGTAGGNDRLHGPVVDARRIDMITAASNQG
jgi:hypothetical protein